MNDLKIEDLIILGQKLITSDIDSIVEKQSFSKFFQFYSIRAENKMCKLYWTVNLIIFPWNTDFSEFISPLNQMQVQKGQSSTFEKNIEISAEKRLFPRFSQK